MPATKRKAGEQKDGLVQRAPDRWSYVIRVPDERTGKTRQKWVSRDDAGQPFTTMKAAKAARDAARAAVHQGTYVARQGITVREYLEQWETAHFVDLRPSTAASYRWMLDAYVLRTKLGDARLQSLTRPMLTAHWQTIAKTGGKGGRPVSGRTVRYAHTLLRKALVDATHDGVLVRDPSAGVKLPRPQVADADDAADDGKTAWSPDTLREFLDATADDRLGPLWTFLAYTGARRGEALALRWKDVDLDAGTARVRRSLTEVDGSLVMNDTPKNHQRRTVPLNASACRVLRSWRKVQAADQLAAGAAWQKGVPKDMRGLVFTTEVGAPLYPNWTSKAFVRAAGDRAPRISLHGLRHTCATLLLRAGEPLAAVSKLLGHKDPSVTLRVYTHALEGDSADSVIRLESIVAGTG